MEQNILSQYKRFATAFYQVNKSLKFVYLTFFLLHILSFGQAQDQVGKYAFDGAVNSIVNDASGNTFVGGAFTTVGLYTGNGVKINAGTDSWDTSYAKTNNSVFAVVSIPGGGWYIGGNFNSIGGVNRNCLARINADGSLHSFNPSLNSSVRALAIDASGNLYVGGNFTSVGLTPRNRLCKFNNAGVLQAFDPNMSGGVLALAVDASGNLYLGGGFNSAGGNTRTSLCKFDNVGSLQSFNPNINGEVSSLAIDASGNLYVGGGFSSVASNSRNRLCKFDNAGTLQSFNPNMSSNVNALAVDASGNLFAGGQFTTVEGATNRNYMCKFNNSGTLQSFDPGMNSNVSAIVIDASSNLYVGGQFTSVGGITRNRLCKVDNSGFLQSFNPNMNGFVSALALDASGNLYAGGGFFIAGGTSRNRLCKFDNSGVLQSFDPNMNSFVSALVIDASGNLYAGGDFNTVGVITRNKLCKFDNTGLLQTFNPSMNGIVSAITIDASNNLYVGGSFTTVGGTSRNRLCKLDNTGVLQNFDPNMNSAVNTVVVDASGNLYVGGQFTTAGGNTRNRLCKFDNLGALQTFSPNIGGTVFALALDASSNLYVGGSFSSVNSLTSQRTLCKFDNAGVLQTFSPEFFFSGSVPKIFAIAIDASGNLYTGGVFSTVNGIPRSFLCKFDNVGVLQSFDPIMSGNVNALAVTSSGRLHVGGIFTTPSPSYAVYTPSCPSTASSINASICAGSSYTFNGIPRTIAGAYSYTLVNAAGCDSIITLNLTVLNPQSTINQIICLGGSYSFNGIARTSTGVYLDTLVSALGCDSIITLNLTVIQPASTVNQTICSGSSYLFNGISLTSNGIYLDTLASALGCDSIVTLNLTVAPPIAASISAVSPSRCGLNGTISLSSISDYTLLTINNFSSGLSSPFSTTGSAIIDNGEMQLTSATNSLNGALIYTPVTKPSGFTALFDLNIFSSQASGNNVADGLSFNYGALQSSPIGHEDGMLNGNGLVIRFKEFQTQRVEVVYNGVVKGTYDIDLHYLKIRKVRIAVLPTGKLDLSIGDQVLCSNLDLGTTYSTDNKTTWQFGWGARTGGSNNRHAIDNIEIYSNENSITFTNDNWSSSRALPFFNTTPNTYTIRGGNSLCSNILGTPTIAAFDVSYFTTINNVSNPTCNGRTITVTNSLANDTLVWSDFASRPTLSNLGNLGNTTFANGSVQLTDNTGSQNGGIIFPQTPNAGIFTATFKARVWDGNNADGFSFNYGSIDNPNGAEGGMMNTNTPGLSVGFPTWGTNNILVKYKNNVLTTVSNTGGGGNRASFFTPIEISVNEQYQLTIKWNGTSYLTNYDLAANSTYETDAKTSWQFAWGARTGGQYDRHQLDDILVVGKPGLLYSYDGGSTFETNATKTISGIQAINVVVKADGLCATSTTNLAALAIPTFTPITAICSGSVLTLPTTATNGIVGTWAPIENNLATTTYTFTPTGGGCTTTMSVQVNPLPSITSVNATPSIICDGDSSVLQVTAPLAGTNVYTLAGSGSLGSANGNGISATFGLPSGVATDAAGNVYVADFGNNKIRKITPSGDVTTFAGSGTLGSANGNGTNASFYGPNGVATDAFGNVFVADQYNHKIRKITPAGDVTTFAGSGSMGSDNGNGIAASFNSPTSVATDAAGNVYVADFGNNKIRKISPSGDVTAFAGSNTTAGGSNGNGTAATFNQPIGVATDAAGNVYVADRVNNKIRKITPSGDVTTFAGSGIQGSANGNGTSASFHYPSGVATDAAGNVFVADRVNNKIRMITPSGDVTTLAGSGTSGSNNGNSTSASFNQPLGVATDANGNVYVADANNNKIRKITQTAPCTYSWSGTVNSLSVALDTVSVMPATTTIYTVTASTAAGCTTASAVTVTVKPNYTINASAGANGSITSLGNTAVCQGNNKTYTIVANANYQIADVLVDGISVGAVASYTFTNVTAAHTISVSFVASFAPFITTWKTNNPGTSNSTSITIPTIGSGYNYDVDWNNDGIYDQFGITGNVTHNYGTAGTYTIAIKGSFPRIYFNLDGDRLKITSIVQWGDIAWTSMSKAFMGCSNLGSAFINDNPNLSAVSDLSLMFFNATNFNQNISNWNVGAVTNMSYMFYNAKFFNQPIGNWNVSAVTNMSYMFYNTNFNLPLGNWNVAAVTNMSYMFYNAQYFNSDISTWNVGNVTNMAAMFSGANFFNQDIGTWNVGAVTNMSGMFNDAKIFNQNISTWNVGAVTNMSSMFSNDTAFNQNISTWNVGAVTNMSNMFNNAINFNQNIGTWNVDSVTNMNGMFNNAINFNQNIGNWNVGAVTEMNSMFGSATSFNQNIGNWNVGAVIDMGFMFNNAIAFNQNIGNWTVGAVTSMSAMFSGATSFNQNIGNWNVGAVLYLSSMFNGATAFNQPIGTWNVGAVTNANGMFNNATSFNQNIENWNVSAITDMAYMFNGATAFNQNIGNWNVEAVIDMSGMLKNATSFNQDISNWNILGVTDIYQIFTNSNISQINYDKILIAWNAAGYSNLYVGNISPLKYCTGAAARDSLLNNGWTITGDAFFCSCVTTSSTFNQSICAGSSYLFNGIARTTSGTYLDTLVNAGGCDSIVTLNLTIKSTSTSSTNLSICSTELPYSWNGLTFTSGDSQTFHTTNSVGCDSAATLNLTISSTSASTTNLSICSSELPYTWNGLTFTSGGSQTYHTTNSVGCDSAATLNLTIKSISASSTNLSICSSELPYTWNGLTFTSGGSQTYHTTNSVGCDSAATLNLTIKSISTSATNLSICSTELPYSWNGLTFTSGGSQTYHTTNSVGCDSAATLNLTIKSTSASSTNLSICSSELPYTWNGLTFTSGGSQTFYTTNSVGCDSAATLNLTIKSTSSTSITVSQAGCYTWAANNTTYTISGIYSLTYTNAVGCDSTSTLSLTITPSVKLSIKALLAGPFDAASGLMHDSLRVLGLIPSSEPYSYPPYNRTPIGETNGESFFNSSVLNVVGSNAIVDWVLIEIRSALNPSTILANKRALIQRDGDIVSTDGISFVTFTTIPNGNYYVSVKHRSHLGIMTSTPIALSSCSSTSIDFTTSSPVYTISSITNLPRKLIGTVYAMWSGDANANKNVKYNGLSNDKDYILTAVGAGTPNNSLGPVYRMEDANMDGKVRFNNSDNDRSIIINNIGTSTPNNILNQHTPN